MGLHWNILLGFWRSINWILVEKADAINCVHSLIKNIVITIKWFWFSVGLHRSIARYWPSNSLVHKIEIIKKHTQMKSADSFPRPRRIWFHCISLLLLCGACETSVRKQIIVQRNWNGLLWRSHPKPTKKNNNKKIYKRTNWWFLSCDETAAVLHYHDSIYTFEYEHHSRTGYV